MILAILIYICFGIGYLFINYIYVCVYFANKKDTIKFYFRRKARIFFLFAFEGFIILVLAILQENYTISDFYKEMRGYSSITLIVFSIILFGAAFSYNLLGVHIIHSTKRRRNDDENITTNMKKPAVSNKYISFIKWVLAVMATPILALGVIGFLMETQRTSFKVIPEQILEGQLNDDLTDETTFRLNDNNQYSLYAVVFENEDVYILCQLSKSEGKFC